MADQRARTPCKEDLLKIPRWARVAFAARCARRGQPFFNTWKGASKKHLEDLDRSMTLCEVSARLGRAEIAPCDVAAARSASAFAYNDSRAAIAASHVAQSCGAPPDAPEARDYATASRAALAIAERAAIAASRAAYAYAYAAHAAAAARAADSASATTPRASAAHAAAAARAADIADNGVYATDSMWSDYDHLLRLSQVERWTDDSPVDSDRLGPL